MVSFTGSDVYVRTAGRSTAGTTHDRLVAGSYGASMSGFEFAKLIQAWSLITPPLRPNQEVVAAIKQCIGQHDGRALLLGVTPEFADLATGIVATDINLSMVRGLWPGDTG